jgi:excisionase family DNA binding protein
MFDSSAAKQPYFDVRSAAVWLGVAEVTLRRMVTLRRISHLRVGTGARRVLFTQEHLDAYLKSATIPAAQAAA